MDSNEILETAKEGSKAANKLMDVLEKIFGPSWTRKQADADYYAAEQRLRLIRENPDMDIIYTNGQFNAKIKNPEVLQVRAALREQHEAIRQQANIENIISQAANELQGANDGTVSDDPVDDDWVTRFFGITKDISSAEMQFIWSKILAGEIKKPGSFSLRTLEVIRNLSQREATAFKKIIPFVVNNGPMCFLLKDLDYKEKYNIQHTDFLMLDACGLITLTDSTVYNPKVTNEKFDYIQNDFYIIFTQSPAEQEVFLSSYIYPLTTVGQELYSILDHPDNEDVIKDMAKSIFEKNTQKANIFVHKLISKSENNGNYRYNFNVNPIICYNVENPS